MGQSATPPAENAAPNDTGTDQGAAPRGLFVWVGRGAGLACLLLVSGLGLFIALGSLPYTDAVLFGGSPPPAALPAAADGWIEVELIGIGVLALGLLAGTGWSPLSRVTRPLRRTVRRYVVGAVVAGSIAYLGMTLTIHMAAAYETGGAEGTAGKYWASLSRGTVLLSGLRAGTVEEISYIAVPFMVFFGIVWVFTRRANGVHLRPPSWVMVAGIVATSLLCAGLRFDIHSYQGLAPGLAAVIWALINVGAYLGFRTIAPVIIAHALVDGLYAGDTSLLGFALQWAAVAVIVVWVVWRVIAARHTTSSYVSRTA
jgi:hypothetical protein